MTAEGYGIDWIARQLRRTSQSVRGKREALVPEGDFSNDQ